MKVANPRVIAVGERPCKVCGKPHDAHEVPETPTRWGSWADLEDGHSYYKYSWEAIARAAIFEAGGWPSLNSLARADAECRER